MVIISAILLARLLEALARERRTARTDSLTKLLNRGELVRLGQRELDHAQRYDRSMALALIDVDHFKALNDSLGHAEGDICLRTLADLLTRRMRKTDLVGRVGGDEFVLVLPETSRIDAENLARQIRSDLREQGQAADWPVDISIGVAECTEDGEDLDALLATADARMYEMKRQQRGGR